MKKLLLITIILLLKSFPSFGEWKELGSTSEGVHFIEKDTIRKNKELTHFNGLTDFFEPNIEFSLSSIYRSVINCKSKKFRIIRMVNYLDSMGKGKIVFEFTFEVKKMIEFEEGGNYKLFYKYICK